MKLLSNCLLIVLLACLTAAAQGQSSDTEEEGEVIVIADLSRAELRQYIEEVEEEVYAIFNARNADDNYDIHCGRMTPTGTNIPQRVCEPKFVTERRSLNVNDYRNDLNDLLTPQQLRAALEPQFRRLTEMMTELAEEDAQFAEIAGILNALRARLNQLQN